MKNFWIRFLSGLLYASLITITVFYSNLSFKVLISILSIIVLNEYFNLIKNKKYFFFLLVLFFIWTPRNLIIDDYLVKFICYISLISSIYCTFLLFFKRSFKNSKINIFFSLVCITTSYFFMIEIHEYGVIFLVLYIYFYFFLQHG